MKLKYFAWVRERIGKAEEMIEPPAGVRTVDDLIKWLSARDVEIGLLDTDGRERAHRRVQPPVIGGKNAISRAPEITASGLT